MTFLCPVRVLRAQPAVKGSAMSDGLTWYRRYPGDFIGGTVGLTLEERGAYSLLLDLMYQRGGPIEDDDRWISRVCECPLQRWRKIRSKLLTMGKLFLEKGRLANRRVQLETNYARQKISQLVESGRRGGLVKAMNSGRKIEVSEPAANEINDLALASASPSTESGLTATFCEVLEPEVWEINNLALAFASPVTLSVVQGGNSQVLGLGLNDINDLGLATPEMAPDCPEASLPDASVLVIEKKHEVFEPSSADINDLALAITQISKKEKEEGSKEVSKEEVVRSPVPSEVRNNLELTLTHTAAARKNSRGGVVADARPGWLQEMVEVWNSVTADRLPRIREMSPSRQDRLAKLRRGRFSADGSWREFCEQIAASDFLSNGHFGVDWVIKPANLAKVLEGNYRNRTPRRSTPEMNPANLSGFALARYRRLQAEADEANRAPIIPTLPLLENENAD
jgi:uncharacterized protein YdaU (DUF1376 family)